MLSFPLSSKQYLDDNVSRVKEYADEVKIWLPRFFIENIEKYLQDYLLNDNMKIILFFISNKPLLLRLWKT